MNQRQTLGQGTDVFIFFHISDEAVTTAKTVIHGIIAGVPLPFPVPDDNACHVMKCPIAAGTTEIYSPSLKCEPSYPKVLLYDSYKIPPLIG